MQITKRMLAVVVCWTSLSAGADALESGFGNPPAQTKPWCYWHWLSDNISKEGITRDLEAMQRVGIGEALLANIYLTPEYGLTTAVGNVRALTPEWWELLGHTFREGGRLGVNIGLFNCFGWSQSGGPWIQPEQTMRYLASTEMRVTGPAHLAQQLPVPTGQFQDVAVLAYPAPESDSDSLVARAPRIECRPAVADREKLADGRLDTAVVFGNEAKFTVELDLEQPLLARSLLLYLAEPFGAEVEVQAAKDGDDFRTIRRFRFDRTNGRRDVGFLLDAPVAMAIAPTMAKAFRLVFTQITPGKRDFHVPSRGAALAEIKISGAVRLESFVEKQLGRMHPSPLPKWDAYLWPAPSEPDSSSLTVPVVGVRDLSRHVSPGGALRWEVPPGEWVIQRVVMTPTGMSNSPASPASRGFEVDKLNQKHVRRHFDAFVGEALRRFPASARKSFKHVVIDSYEMGAQNWTEGFDRQFRRRYGYDPKPWLPVLAGRIVESADHSERFLWDLRRLTADLVATEYVGGLRRAARPHGLELWLENYGHWGFPSEFLKYGGQSDRVAGEFWVTGDLGGIECRGAASCANTYGKSPIVSVEAFTGGPPFQNSPAALKARGDWAFCEGVNHFVLHAYIHQPYEDKLPGVNAWFGTEFNRHNTWFARSKAWVDYVQRCSWLLQQGHRVTDVAYFIGEDAPKMTGTREPELPPGRDFDYINAEVIERNLSVRDGLLTLPHGVTYRLLVLPPQETMRPKLLRKLHALVAAGATIYGLPPLRSPSMEDFPECDAEVRRVAADIWGDANTTQPGERRIGNGRVVWGQNLDAVLAAHGSKPDFESATPLRYTHRRDATTDIYFVANPKAAETTTAAFRVNGKAPELWWPDSGRIEYPAVYDEADGRVRLPLTLGPQGSVFVVFRAKAAPKSERIISVTRNGREVLGTTMRRGIQPETGDQPNNFTFALWVKPEGTTTLPKEANHGVLDLSQPRNEVLPPRHGNEFGGGRHAGSGLAVSRNGVCVLEHAADYFAAPLVYAGELTNWTHLTVVYRDGQPSLYLNGRLARVGLPSTRNVHSSATRGSAASFQGARSVIEQFARAMSETEVRSLMESMPRPGEDATGLPLQLTRTATGRIKAQGGRGGDYELRFADGQRRSLRMTKVVVSDEITGPWEVSFVPPRGTPIKTTFPGLTDWTQQSEVSIKYFSGTATYRGTFTWKPENPSSSAFNSRVLLDLGEVRDLATVRLNGRGFTTLWMAPWRVDVTTDLKFGTNLLEVEVINPWNNRLVGDASLPESQRQTVLLADTVNKNSPLLPAGLLGPVRLMSSEAVEMK